MRGPALILRPAILSLPLAEISDDMTIWGKILGGAAGFALGGPIGALVGALAGHSVDLMSDAGGEAAVAAGTEQTAVPTVVIVLGPKAAKADGRVPRHHTYSSQGPR